MFETHFTTEQSWPLWPSLACLFLAILCFEFRNNKKEALAFLLLGALGLRVFAILLDPFINLWDEQYHALVAKSMLEDPFHPMLYTNPVLPFDYHNWSSNHTWLHKQPLFLWQIALSFKLFGVNEVALRLPSLVMSTLTVLLIWKTGKTILNERSAFYGALFFAAGSYGLEMVSGLQTTDHNDVAFLFYVTASIWAYTEYEKAHSKSWMLLIGLFAGLAVLNKWLTGLLVYSGWGLAILLDAQRRGSFKQYYHLIMSLVVSVVVFLPWQLYILNAFPTEAQHEFAYNTAHFTEVVEGHGGTPWFHFEAIEVLYGKLAIYLLPIAIISFAYQLAGRYSRTAFIAYIAIVYCFFTLAETKMSSFTFVISPIIYLALGSLLNHCVRLMEPKADNRLKRLSMKFGMVSVLFALCLISFDLKEKQAKHSFWDYDKHYFGYRTVRTNAKSVATALASRIPSKNYVIFNCNQHENIPIMFYTGYTAYDYIMTLKEYTHLKTKGVKIAVFDNNQLPPYLAEDTAVYKIKLPFLSKISEKQISMRAMNGKYVCADHNSGSHVIARSDSIGPWESFKIICFAEGKCAFAADNDRYFCSDLNAEKKIIANRASIGEWELFLLVRLAENQFAFKAANNKYVSVGSDGQLLANSGNIGSSETFILDPAP